MGKFGRTEIINIYNMSNTCSIYGAIWENRDYKYIQYVWHTHSVYGAIWDAQGHQQMAPENQMQGALGRREGI